ncbi:MAG TPA: adenylate/guanylate cyclase domain-containing protein [Gaiellaceae bacterium]|nr:adenylate/guanylate cyclase domain-containing protein [Gaiellaceae bacterium]
MAPETRYARSGDVNIAYQVAGEGPTDLVYVPGWMSNVELMWERPEMASFLGRLASFSRLILFDKRGTGLSDRVSNDKLPTLEERMDDVRAVLETVGSQRAALFGHSEGGNMCVLFAATYPERTRALITLGCFAKRRDPDDDYPWAPEADDREEAVLDVERNWGRLRPEDVEYYSPSRAGDEQFVRHLEQYFRRSASPGAAAALLRMNSYIDVREVLPTIRVPTLVLHRTGDRDVNIAEGRYLAAKIPGAKFVELPGDDHWISAGDTDAIADEIEEFLTGTRPVPEPDRVLATVLFTDLVGSTARAAELGDRRWRDLLAAHDASVRRELERFRGREVDTAGDGFFATFDGPARAVRCALSIGEAVRELGVEVRAGVHTGECELDGPKVRGIAVHTGARIASLAGPGEVLVSQTVKDLVSGSGLAFEDRGARELKGVPGEWRIYAAV